MHKTDKESRFLLVSIVPRELSEQAAFLNIRELISLVESFQGSVEDILLQKREVHDKGAYIGRGKIDEVAVLINDKQIDVVVLNAIVKPGQIYELQSYLEKFRPGIEVWDRVDLILKIFARQANTAESKLQIELAAMRHMGPRIYGMGDEMSRQGGMVGTRGIGETNTERMKRHWREQIKKVRDDLELLKKKRKMLMEVRQKQGFPTVSLIGYTNAGKTSLFNKLTNKQKSVKDALFVTLDSTVGDLYLKTASKKILVSDTIGFIQNLPPQLIDAFQSTLMESIYSDLLIHVIDLSDENMMEKIRAVEEILGNLKIQSKKRIYVFNKTDKSSNTDRDKLNKEYRRFNPLFISVKNNHGLEELKEVLSAEFSYQD